MSLTRIALRSQICSSEPSLRHGIVHRLFTTSTYLHSEASHLPRVAEPSFWRSLVPKALRRDDGSALRKSRTLKSKSWNPATPFIVLGIVVGSFAINILSVKREMLNFSRKTDGKLVLLREVLQRVKAGEDVDVEKLLGTGDPVKEQEWEDMMQDLETADVLAEARQRKLAKAKKRQVERALKEEQIPKAVNEDTEAIPKSSRPKFIM